MGASAWDRVDWEALARLRAGFLGGSAGETDYWKSESDLASYDLTYAQRIGWKWDHVLADLHARGWTPPPGEILDWGCGSGIAHRAFFHAFPPADGQPLALWDRSPLALDFARRRVTRAFPGVRVRVSGEGPVGTLLLSHVMTELPPGAIPALMELIRGATTLLWVEAGTYEVSRALGVIREELLGEFHPVAPCVHRGACGILAEENTPHWCHHFAEPPAGIFTDGNWARFANVTGIDLRSLPVSYLVLDRRPPPSLPPHTLRLIGRPRLYKPYALAMGCDAAGVRELRITKRRLPEVFRAARKGRLPGLPQWVREGDEVIEAAGVPEVGEEPAPPGEVLPE
ncbi:MAG TPA: hypothetical protein DCM86_01715 [Verrucomicrobiales bacterium]|nr:hypothetical protein [Verrucomicrobiales bacterium]